MNRNAFLKFASLAAFALALSACSTVEEQLGLTKQPPDEFRVVTRAPLAIPPEFELRPPQPGATRPQEGTAQQQARQAVFRNTDSRSEQIQSMADQRSQGEKAFLASANAGNANPEIRQVVDRESKAIAEESESFVEALIFWRDAPPAGDVVDADAEAARLRANAALGKPSTEGETPTIERKEKAIFEDIF